jgi:nucleotide-binding universal stress UspA family protein
MYDAICCPTDGSDGALAAAAHAASLAATYGSTVHVVAVADTKSYGTLETGGAEVVVPALEERCEGDIDRQVAAVREAYPGDPDDLAVETAVLHGFPSEEILRYVEREGVDLVVMGTHGRRGLERVLLGSVAANVVRRSPVPVVTVRGES